MLDISAKLNNGLHIKLCNSMKWSWRAKESAKRLNWSEFAIFRDDLSDAHNTNDVDPVPVDERDAIKSNEKREMFPFENYVNENIMQIKSYCLFRTWMNSKRRPTRTRRNVVTFIEFRFKQKLWIVCLSLARALTHTRQSTMTTSNIPFTFAIFINSIDKFEKIFRFASVLRARHCFPNSKKKKTKSREKGENANVEMSSFFRRILFGRNEKKSFILQLFVPTWKWIITVILMCSCRRDNRKQINAKQTPNIHSLRSNGLVIYYK